MRPPSLPLLAALSCLLLACGPEKTRATYVVAPQLFPGRPSECVECGLGLVMRAVPVDAAVLGQRPYLQEAEGAWDEAGFQIRWGVEQTVELETWEEGDDPDVEDDSGFRVRMVRVLDARPVAPGTRFGMSFPALYPLPAEVALDHRDFDFVAEAGGVRLTPSVPLVTCTEAALCEQLLSLDEAERAFTLELAHTGTDGAPLALEGVRLD